PVVPLEWHDPKSGDISSGYRETGYLPQAVVNFLALLGWNPGDDTEIMSMDDLIARFSLDHCSKAGAKFAFEKCKWFNHEYIMAKTGAELTGYFKPIMLAHGVNPADFSDDYIAASLEMVKGRVNLLPELWDQARFFFAAPLEYAEKDIRKRWKAETPALMAKLIEIIEGLPSMASKEAEDVVLGWITDNGYHMGNVMNAFRLAVVGECKGPHMFDIAELMGREEIIGRIRLAIERIPQPAE
ncbi:MAG: glutamate--tRNA ligase, partial [Muribaculaceae bacterium]|nr:glutamate--tRNA ligase [Muribaculaceae bacterium]